MYVSFSFVWCWYTCSCVLAVCHTYDFGQDVLVLRTVVCWLRSICHGHIGSWSHWVTEHVSALVRAPPTSQFPNLKVLPGSTISYHSDNRQSEHSFMSAEISHKTKSRRSQTACALGCLAPAGPPWIPRCIVRVFHATCCFLPLNKIVGFRLRNRVRCCETASCQRQDNAESHGAD